MTTLTKANYDSNVKNLKDAFVIVFTAPWDDVGIKTVNFLKTVTNLEVFSVDFDSERELVQQYSVRRLPLVFLVKSGVTAASAPTCESPADLDKLLGNIK